MKLLKDFERIDVNDLYVGEIFDPQVYMLDENGKLNGATKAFPIGKFDVATKNAEGDFVSVSDGTVYSDGSMEKIVAGKTRNKMFFWNVESYAKVTGKKGKVSKKAAAKEAQAINAERTQNVEV